MNGFFPVLFSILNEEKIPYAVLRNYEKLPECPDEGSDVDLLLGKNKKQAYLEKVKEAVNKTNSFILLKSDRSNCLSLFVYQSKSKGSGVWLDAFFEMSSRGIFWGDAEFLLKSRILLGDRGFYTVTRGGEAATLFVKEIFSRSFIKEKYRQRIPNLASSDRDNFLKTIRPYFGEKVSDEIFTVARNGDWKKSCKKRRIWLSVLVFRDFLQRPASQKMNLFRFSLGYIRWQFAMKGISIALAGPDGVGKTTASEKLEGDLKKLFFKKVYRYHGHFGFFPEWGALYRWIFRKKKSQSPDFPREEKKISSLRGALSILYYGLEHLLAWPWIFYLKIRGNVLLFDRYFYDFATLNTDSRFPLKLFWLLTKIVNRPDLTFIITAAPETIYSRKKELGLPEIRRQKSIFEERKIANLKSVFFINGEDEPEKVAEKMKGKILEYLTKKI